MGNRPVCHRMVELRVYLPIHDLQPQFAAWLSTPVRARGYPPFAGQPRLIIAVAPALSIHRIADLAPKKAPALQPGLLFTERQFGLLELHSDDAAEIKTAGQAILDGIGAKPADQYAPQIVLHDIITDLSDQHAVILNRSRDGSMLTPGASLLVCEMAPALFACVAVNEAERAAPDAVVVDVQMMGVSGRVFMSGGEQDMERARATILKTLQAIDGRDFP